MHDTLLFVDISIVGVTTIFGLILIFDAIVSRSKEEKNNAVNLNN